MNDKVIVVHLVALGRGSTAEVDAKIRLATTLVQELGSLRESAAADFHQHTDQPAHHLPQEM